MLGAMTRRRADHSTTGLLPVVLLFIVGLCIHVVSADTLWGLTSYSLSADGQQMICSLVTLKFEPPKAKNMVVNITGVDLEQSAVLSIKACGSVTGVFKKTTDPLPWRFTVEGNCVECTLLEPPKNCTATILYGTVHDPSPATRPTVAITSPSTVILAVALAALLG